jgi:D-3-phosphoglycerate dehydrogenase
MPDPVEPLVLDLLEWIAARPRTHAEALEVWRTSCPRLPVWEEANARGFIDHLHEPGKAARVMLSPAGLERLKAVTRAKPALGRTRPKGRTARPCP